jgi:hypothetical protein
MLAGTGSIFSLPIQMKHEKLHHPSQLALAERHADLVADVELVADRANAARHDPQPHAADIVEAAEVALIRVQDAWRKSRGGTQNNLFFQPLSVRLRRIIGHYKKHADIQAARAASADGGPWVYKITDYEALQFDRLKPWFRASAVHDAIQTGIMLGLRELPGLLIWKQEQD